MASGRGEGLLYIGGYVKSGPSDQTDLKQRRRCNLGGSGEPTFEGEDDMWVPWADRPASGVGWPHMSAPRGLLWWVAFRSVLESSHISFAADKRDLL